MRAPWRRAAIAIALLLLAGFGISCAANSGQTGSGDPSPAVMHAYKSRLEKEAMILLGWVARITGESEAGRIPQAQSRYASARVPFGHLKPFLTAYPDLNTSLDVEADGLPKKAHLAGFHRVEYLLWTTQSTRVRRRAVGQLLLSAERLLRLVQSKTLGLKATARVINEVMEGTITQTISGRAEPNAHVDLLDLSATVEGVQAAFETVAPALHEVRPHLVQQIQTAFNGVYVEVTKFGIAAREPEQPRAGSPGVSFVSYDDADPRLVDDLSRRIDSLDGLLAEVPAVLEEAEAK